MAGENPVPGVNERGLFCPFSLAPGTSAFWAAPTKSRLIPDVFPTEVPTFSMLQCLHMAAVVKRAFTVATT